MKLYKIVFTEWRDAPVQGAPVTELEVASKRVTDHRAAEAGLRREIADIEEVLEAADTPQLKSRQSVAAAELANVAQSRMAAEAALDKAGAAAAAALARHAMVGKAGYQVLNDDGRSVARVVDADGHDLPAGAVYGYQVTDTAPALPAWAAARVEVAP